MTASSGHPALRAGIAQALSHALAEHSQRYLGELLGIAGSTISRRAEDLHLWPSVDLLSLAVHHQELADAVVRYLRGDQAPMGEAVALVGDLHALLAECGRLLSEAAEVLADGRVTRDEAIRLAKIIQAVQTRLLTVSGDLQTLGAP
jgi:hypothetical protein